MFEIKKTFTISAAHKLDLDYESKCKELHGHNWIITVYCRSSELDKNGMVVDFTDIKRKIQDKLDHKNLNDVFELGWEEDIVKGDTGVKGIHIYLNPTAERIAEWICMQIPKCYRVDVGEVEGSIATYYES